MNDLINSIFELFGAIVIWKNVKQLIKDKQVKGVYYPLWIFYATWGFWNLYYYPSLNQHLSFYAGIVMVIGNTIWVSLAFYYGKKNDRK